jgi:predicted nucleotidyltransferase
MELLDVFATYARAVPVEIEGVQVPVIALADLIAMKREAGRAKDLEDASALEAILEEDRDG